MEAKLKDIFNQGPKIIAESAKSPLGIIALIILATSLLGTLHGSSEKKRFLILLRSAIERASLNSLKRLWLVVPEGNRCENYLKVLIKS